MLINQMPFFVLNEILKSYLIPHQDKNLNNKNYTKLDTGRIEII